MLKHNHSPEKPILLEFRLPIDRPREREKFPNAHQHINQKQNKSFLRLSNDRFGNYLKHSSQAQPNSGRFRNWLTWSLGWRIPGNWIQSLNLFYQNLKNIKPLRKEDLPSQSEFKRKLRRFFAVVPEGYLLVVLNLMFPSRRKRNQVFVEYLVKLQYNDPYMQPQLDSYWTKMQQRLNKTSRVSSFPPRNPGEDNVSDQLPFNRQALVASGPRSRLYLNYFLTNLNLYNYDSKHRRRRRNDKMQLHNLNDTTYGWVKMVLELMPVFLALLDFYFSPEGFISVPNMPTNTLAPFRTEAIFLPTVFPDLATSNSRKAWKTNLNRRCLENPSWCTLPYNAPIATSASFFLPAILNTDQHVIPQNVNNSSYQLTQSTQPTSYDFSTSTVTVQDRQKL